MSSRGKPITRQIREQRQREAAVRQAEYDALSLQQKIDRLPAPPAAARQRAKLMSLAHKPMVTIPSGTGTSNPVDAEDRFIKFGDSIFAETEPKKLKAKERRAQENK